MSSVSPLRGDTRRVWGATEQWSPVGLFLLWRYMRSSRVYTRYRSLGADTPFEACHTRRLWFSVEYVLYGL